jgi:hypothetical protein
MVYFMGILRTYFLGKKTLLLEANNTFCRKNTYLLPKDLLARKTAHCFRKWIYLLEKKDLLIGKMAIVVGKGLTCYQRTCLLKTKV